MAHHTSRGSSRKRRVGYKAMKLDVVLCDKDNKSISSRCQKEEETTENEKLDVYAKIAPNVNKRKKVMNHSITNSLRTITTAKQVEVAVAEGHDIKNQEIVHKGENHAVRGS